MNNTNKKETNKNHKLKIWPIILGAFTYIIIDAIFDIPNFYDVFKILF